MKKTKNVLRIVWVISMLLHAQVVFAWWNTEVVDKRYFGIAISLNSLAVGDNGNSHIVYFVDGEIIYAYHDKWNWHKEVVDNSEYPYNYPSIAVDTSGKPHIIYFNKGNELMYSYKDSSEWLTEIVGDDIYQSKTSLALDRTDNPHICYYSLEEDEEGLKTALKYAHKDSSGWHDATAVSGSTWRFSQPYSIALALDRTDNPHISYYSKEEVDEEHWKTVLKYVYKDSAGWHDEIVESDSVLSYTSSTALALDTNDLPHIVSSISGDNASITYVYKDSSGWHTEIVFNPIWSPKIRWGISPPSIALDINNDPHISYGYATSACSPVGLLLPCFFSAAIEYVEKNNLGWQRRTLDRTYGSGVYLGPSFPLPIIQFHGNFGVSSIALGLNGNPHILYTDYLEAVFMLNPFLTSKLKHAYKFGIGY